MGEIEPDVATRSAQAETAPLISTDKLLPTSRKDLICLALLFVLSWYVRLLYQSESITDNPLRADAGKYVWAAYNLKFHGAFSKELPDEATPQTRTDLASGYPIFLTFFVSAIEQPPGWDLALDQIRNWQALMGAASVVCCYALARQGLSLGWSLLAGLLSCISPHLIVVSDYILTESLFQLVLMAGLLTLSVAWRRPHFGLMLAGFLLLALSAEVRYLTLALPVWFLPLFLFRADRVGRSHLRERAYAVSAMVAAVVCVQAMHTVFVYRTVHNAPETAEVASEHFRLGQRIKNITRTMQPPNFFVRGETHVGVRNGRQDWRDRTELPFAAAPGTYLRWNLYGKPLTSWHFDNSYHGDVYIYPLMRSGFEEHILLQSIHRAMHVLHWPLYGLSLAGLAVLLYQSWKGNLPNAARGLWAPALAMLYFLLALYFLAWLPRYSIPARPFSYMLAAGFLCFCAQRLAKPQTDS